MKTHLNYFSAICGALVYTILLIITGCSKELPTTSTLSAPPNNSEYIQYQIRKGKHYCDQTSMTPFDKKEMKFRVQFNETAIYNTSEADNQYDINKLFGFSDNGNADHHSFSARFGWRWSDNALRIFAYVYNNGIRESVELSSILINKEYELEIKIVENKYLFSINSRIYEMPRAATSVTPQGFQLFPYFGGDESAPHDILISMNNSY